MSSGAGFQDHSVKIQALREHRGKFLNIPIYIVPGWSIAFPAFGAVLRPTRARDRRRMSPVRARPMRSSGLEPQPQPNGNDGKK